MPSNSFTTKGQPSLDQITDTNITNAVSGDGLVYNASDGLWSNKPVATGAVSGTNGEVIIVDNTGTGITNTSVLFIDTGAVTEKARIDNTGNFIVGATDTNDINTSGGGNESGFIQGDGVLGLAHAGGVVAIMNRKQSNGSVIELRKNGTAHGNIGVIGGQNRINIYGGAEGSGIGLEFNADNNSIIPSDGSTSWLDNTVDLGRSSARFANIYTHNINGSPYLGGGFTGYDEYYLTSDINSSSNAVITTWTQMEKIGSGMSLSTGIFTFPETGYWLVCSRAYMRSGLNVAGTLRVDTYYSVNNFSSETLYDRQSGTVGNGGDATNIENVGYGEFLLNITDTANQKIRLKSNVPSSGDYKLYGGRTATRVAFKKVG